VAKKEGQFYEIQWQDIISYSDWKDMDDDVRPVFSITRGFLVKTGVFRKLKYSVFAGTVCEDGSYGEVIVIPDGCISKRTKLS